MKFTIMETKEKLKKSEKSSFWISSIKIGLI